MRFSASPFIILLLLISFIPLDFREEQLQYPRVRQAYLEKEDDFAALLSSHSIQRENLRVYLRAFKEEQLIELWAKNKGEEPYQLLREYKVCRSSGVIGPKRQQGDRQVPEGFYHIDRFNPNSNYHLSLGINYPNTSDRILGVQGNLGGNIFIHGACVTIGCLPITDDKIKELYVFCVEAKNSGQETIPVTIFPTKLTDRKFNELKERYQEDTEEVALWTDLKAGYDIFNRTKALFNVVFLNNGDHSIQ